MHPLVSCKVFLENIDVLDVHISSCMHLPFCKEVSASKSHHYCSLSLCGHWVHTAHIPQIDHAD